MMVAAHTRDLIAASNCGLRTGHIARVNEYGPNTGEARPMVPVDVAGKDLADLADELDT
jgi:2-haloacid dehalogenase